MQDKKLIAVLENPKDFKNIGKVIRNVNAFGVEQLFVVDSQLDWPDDWQEMRQQKPLLRTSASAIKWSFVKKFKTTEACLAHLEAHNFVSIATSPHQKGKENVVLHQGDYSQKRLAVWFGNESKGLSDTVLNKSAFCIQIEMFGIIESLNLAISTGIVLYEITKQRRDLERKEYLLHK